MAITGAFASGEEQTFVDVKLEIDQTPAASSFIDVTTWGTNIRVTGGDTPFTPFTTYSVPFNWIGDVNSYTVEIDMVFSEAAATDPFKEIYDDYVASPGLLYDARWSPAGATTGDLQFTTSGGRLVWCSIPTAPAGDGSPVIFTIRIVCSTITLGAAA